MIYGRRAWNSAEFLFFLIASLFHWVGTIGNAVDALVKTKINSPCCLEKRFSLRFAVIAMAMGLFQPRYGTQGGWKVNKGRFAVGSRELILEMQRWGSREKKTTPRARVACLIDLESRRQRFYCRRIAKRDFPSRLTCYSSLGSRRQAGGSWRRALRSKMAPRSSPPGWGRRWTCTSSSSS